MTQRQSCLIDLLVIFLVILLINLVGCAFWHDSTSTVITRTNVVQIPLMPNETTTKYVTNIITYRLSAVIPLTNTTQMSIAWNEPKSEPTGSLIYILLGSHDLARGPWSIIGTMTNRQVTITKLSNAAYFRVVASNTYTHTTSDALVHQIQQLSY